MVTNVGDSIEGLGTSFGIIIIQKKYRFSSKIISDPFRPLYVF